MAFIDSNANTGVKRMGQVRHMKTIFRKGTNAVSGSVPAGTLVKIVKRKR
jgi:hypothetical protein